MNAIEEASNDVLADLCAIATVYLALRRLGIPQAQEA